MQFHEAEAKCDEHAHTDTIRAFSECIVTKFSISNRRYCEWIGKIQCQASYTRRLNYPSQRNDN